MDFDDIIRSSDLSEDIDRVGLAIYYHDKIENSSNIQHKDIRDVIDNSRTKNLSSSAISAYIRYLMEDDLIFKNGDGYRLTHEGIERYELDREDENEKRETNFIQLSHINDQFYITLVEDINKSYREGIDEATLVLTRKLLENLVIDILRARYGLSDNRRELFYNTNKRQFCRFSKLIENVKNNMEDLEYFSDRLDESVVDLLEDLKNQGDASAHSIEVAPSEGDMSEYRKKANQATSILCYTLKKVRESN